MKNRTDSSPATRGADYHDIMTARLRELLAWIQTQTPCAGRVYADTGPLLERELAQRAGLGWIGKNTLLLSRELGSYFFLGEILLDIEIEPDRPHIEQFCGSCTRCLHACPTGAFEAPFVLNANKCISYHTIENRESVPRELRALLGDWVFGCDVCQEVCPWNDKSRAFSSEPELWTRWRTRPALAAGNADAAARRAVAALEKTVRSSAPNGAACAATRSPC